MRGRNLAPVRALAREMVPIMGKFTLNGAGAIDNTVRKGLGWTAARTGVGTYVVTFTDKWVDIVSVTAGLELVTPASDRKLVWNINVAAKTITFTMLAVGVATESAAGDIIHFCAWCRSSAVLPVRGT